MERQAMHRPVKDKRQLENWQNTVNLLQRLQKPIPCFFTYTGVSWEAGSAFGLIDRSSPGTDHLVWSGPTKDRPILDISQPCEPVPQ